MSEKLASAGLMVLFPILSPEEINLITVKEQRISDKFKKKKAQSWENIYCKYNLPCNAGESKVMSVHCYKTNTKVREYTPLCQQPHAFLSPHDY